MSDDISVRVEGLGKKYIIGHEAKRERYVALRDVIARNVKTVMHKTFDLARGIPMVSGDTTEEFWALKDVSFEVKQGEVVGIVGRNGAGKSTLLKVLSRITDPSEGRVTIYGRVASLLEVGTGFHPELTGRENIYLNGAILGMRRAEIKRKFDEIVAFSEVEKFLDTPVKRYSSGMYVRLAFAVAGHLEPDILIVDEVLAVGDAQFQKKCLGRMKEVSASGRTVLFVSHNIGALLASCDSGILFSNGKVVARGAMREVAKRYRESASEKSTLNIRAFEGPLKSVKFESFTVNKTSSESYYAVRPGETLTFSVTGRSGEPIPNFQFLFSFFSEDIRVFTTHLGPELLPEGKFVIEVVVPPWMLRPAIYSVAFGARSTSSGEWSWGQGLGEIEVIEEWSERFHRDDLGVLNLPERLMPPDFKREVHNLMSDKNTAESPGENVVAALGDEPERKSTLSEIFSRIYELDSWTSGSGPGSLASVNAPFVRFLETFILLNSITRIVDYGCGDWQYMSRVNLCGVDYLGLDVVDGLLGENVRRYSRPNIRFSIAPHEPSELPEGDLILFKDVLIHSPNAYVMSLLEQAQRKFRFILVVNNHTSNPSEYNGDVPFGGFRPLDLSLPPFSLSCATVLRYGSAAIPDPRFPRVISRLLRRYVWPGIKHVQLALGRNY